VNTLYTTEGKKGGVGKGEGTVFLNLFFFCDVSVAVGGHIDLSPTHYYY
jgi:hypothetical protein